MEVIVAGRFGIPRKRLRECRRVLTRGEEWKRTPQGIIWTDTGLKWLTSKFARERADGENKGKVSPEGGKQTAKLCLSGQIQEMKEQDVTMREQRYENPAN